MEAQKRRPPASKTKKSSKSASLKAKLKREIEELKRNKILHHQRLEEERSRNEEAKILQQRKDAEKGEMEKDNEISKLDSNKKENPKEEVNQALDAESAKVDSKPKHTQQSSSVEGHSSPNNQTSSQNVFVTHGMQFNQSAGVNGASKYLDSDQCSSSYHEQKMAEEKRRKEQREVLRRQAAELLEKTQTGNASSNNAITANSGKNPASGSTASTQNDDPPSQVKTHERMNSSRHNTPQRLPAGLTPEQQRLFTEEQRRREQREVLKRQAAELLKKKEAESTDSTQQQINVTTDIARFPAETNEELDEQRRLVADDHRRKEQRESLRRQADELLKKKGMEGMTTPVKTERRLNKKESSSAKSDFYSPQVESILAEEKRRKEQREVLKRQAAELMKKKEEEEKLGAVKDQSPTKRTSKIEVPLTPEEQKLVAEEKRRKEQREVLRRQAAELLKRKAEVSISNGGGSARKEEEQSVGMETVVQVPMDLSSCMNVETLERHIASELHDNKDSDDVNYQEYSLASIEGEATITRAEGIIQDASLRSPVRAPSIRKRTRLDGRRSNLETDKEQKSLDGDVEFGTIFNNSPGIRISSAYHLIYSSPQQHGPSSPPRIPLDEHKRTFISEPSVGTTNISASEGSSLPRISLDDHKSTLTREPSGEKANISVTEDKSRAKPSMFLNTDKISNDSSNVCTTESSVKAGQECPVVSMNELVSDSATTVPHTSNLAFATNDEGTHQSSINKSIVTKTDVGSPVYQLSEAASHIPQKDLSVSADASSICIQQVEQSSRSEEKNTILSDNTAASGQLSTGRNPCILVPNQYQRSSPGLPPPDMYHAGVAFAGYQPPYMTYPPIVAGYGQIPLPMYQTVPLMPYPPYIHSTMYPYYDGAVAPYPFSIDRSHNPDGENENQPPVQSQQEKRVPTAMSSKPIKKKAEPRRFLSADPLIHPSPFSFSHVLVEETILLVKRPEESFGVTVSLAVDSVLSPFMLDISKAADADTVKRAAVEHKVDSESEKKFFMDEANPSNTPTLGTNNDKSSDGTPSGESFPETQLAGTNDISDESKQKPKRRPRRRRIFFSVMTVTDASVQNSRNYSLPDGSASIATNNRHSAEAVKETNSDVAKLQKGDILLSINGHPTAGLTFPDACGLFKGCSYIGIDGLISCPVTVARLKPAPKVPIPVVPEKLDSEVATSIADRLPLRQIDFIVLATGILKAVVDLHNRFVGNAISDEELNHQIASTDLSLSKLPLSLLKQEWRKVELHTKDLILLEAAEYWKKVSFVQPVRDEKNTSVFVLLTDAKLCSLRAAPRPTNGQCKCGSRDHQYVNDPSCFLYSKLRELDEAESEPAMKTGPQSKPALGDLNAVEKALTDRLLRRKSELEAEENEAKFVDRMETIQIRQCNQAVFAPTLESIVLSAVVELGLKYKEFSFSRNNFEFQSQKETSSKPLAFGGAENESDDDDDDVPLALLCNKRANNEVGSSGKKRRGEFCLRYHFLAILVRHISEKWGHVYREPSHAEYSWRWEVFHGQHSIQGSRWVAGSKNPREVDSLSLENARFLLNDETISAFELANDETAYCKAMKALSFILSPQQTGICDELLSLVHLGVLRVDEERGIPVLAKDWYSGVDAILLNEMHQNWGYSSDPVGKYGIVDEIRSLRDYWKRADEGWLLKDEDEIVFYFDEFEEWRAAFEDKHKAQCEGNDGIGRFY